MSKISLNASMRSNLLSLQQTQKLQDKTQLRLSTGLKVNSAIDNPSSYYTASALNNRAEDLGTLLDAMSQGIQVIKTANEALETGTALLQQAKAVASQFVPDYQPVKVDVEKLVSAQNKQRLEAAGTPVSLSKDWLLANGADYVVTNEAELRNAVLNATTGQKIVINGNVTINGAGDLNLASGVSLLGAESFDSRAVAANGGYQSSLTVTSQSSIVLNGDAEISGIEVNSAAQNAITVKGNANKIENVQINMNSAVRGSTAIRNLGELNVKNINIITNEQEHAKGIKNEKMLKIDGYLNIETNGKWGHAVGTYKDSTTTVESTAQVNIHTTGAIAAGFDLDTTSLVEIKGALINIASDQSRGFINENYGPTTGGNTLKIASGTELNINATGILSNNKGDGGVANPQTGTAENIVEIAQGVKINFYDNVQKAQNKLETSREWSNKAGTTAFVLGLNLAEDSAFTPVVSNAEHNQFNSILNQYNQLLSDASYKGINLLREGNLKINFNEERSSGIEVKGVDASSKNLGISDQPWVNHLNVEQSITELEDAINQLRSYAAEFGNYYSIVSTRQDFTENLMNVLSEGADKLTLADMNEESANVLALQTRQQLAINSLSLASQASQSVLKLF